VAAISKIIARTAIKVVRAGWGNAAKASRAALEVKACVMGVILARRALICNLGA
jgi:hypothetical protein